MTSITVYDGNDTIGGNKIYVEERGQGLFLDFGANLHNYDKFYKWPNQPRTIRGIYDYWHLNFIPHLNIYRQDLIPSDLDISSFPKLDVRAVLLSHVHMDHYGCIGFLNKSIPVVASSITLALLKGLQDTITMDAGCEVIYINKRRPDPSEKRVLSPVERCGRSLVTTDLYNNNIEEFLWQRSRKTAEIKRGKLTPLKDYELPFNVIPYQTDHSVYGSVAYVLEGDHSIAYTGDIRLHGERKQKSKHFVNSARNSDILIIEGTRLTGENIFDSEEFVYDACYRAVDMAKGLVIADFTSRNLERLEIFKQIASETNRQLVITPKDAYLLYVLELADNIDHLRDIGIYQRPMSKSPYWEYQILQENKHPEYITSKAINNNPDRYILCFSSWDIPNFLDIRPDKGIYIYSSTGAYKTEQEFDFIRLNEWLKFTEDPNKGIRPKGFRIEEIDKEKKPIFTRGFHASGHASEDEIEW
ncbi:MAG: MBL fold metallo-hydrolase, partial [Candidatus Hodarchaeota archaeon]